MSAPRRILLVDDEANARYALAELLRDEGFDVETASHGAEALQKLPAFRPEVLISDLEMPGMDSLDLVVNARSGSDAPLVIVMTSFGQRSKALAALQVGASDYLTKPIRFDELLVVLAKAIRLHDMEREIAWLRQREQMHVTAK